jgi:hypothetical protein
MNAQRPHPTIRVRNVHDYFLLGARCTAIDAVRSHPCHVHVNLRRLAARMTEQYRNGRMSVPPHVPLTSRSPVAQLSFGNAPKESCKSAGKLEKKVSLPLMG